MTVTFIVPTRNAFAEKKGCLELTIRSLFHQQLECESEIIIVDNGSTDGTADFISTFSRNAPWPIRLVSCPEVGAKALARNAGAAEARGDVLFFIDDDTLMPNSRSVSCMLSKLTPASFVCGIERRWTYIGWNADKIRNELKHDSYEYALNISHLPDGIDRDSGYRSLLHVSFIANFGCMERKLFDRVGGFDERYVGWGRHDCDLMYRFLVEAKAKFENAFTCGPIIHLNHGVKGQKKDLAINEGLYQELERKHGLALRYSHLFGLKEHDDDSVFTDKEGYK